MPDYIITIMTARAPPVQPNDDLPYTSWNAEINCGELNFSNEKYLLDVDDFNVLSKNIRRFHYDKCPTDPGGMVIDFDETNKYPYYYNTNNKKVCLLECLYEHCPIIHKYVFLNGNEKDLRHENVKVFHKKHDDVMCLYPDAKYIGGHYTEKGKNAYIIQNPIWEIIENNKKTFIMFALPDKLSYICEEGMNRIRLFEKEYNHDNPITWSCINKKHICGSINNENMKKIILMHQIIMNFYGHGKGTMGLSVDHIDRNPLNNRIENLRVADRKTQELNSKGIAPGTKRERQCIARPLPEGITQDMLSKYVVYYLNTYNKEKGLTREYFTVEHHPLLERPWESSKSKDVSIFDKLAAANKVAEDLERGILPTKPERTLPKYFRYGLRNGFPSIVFERRTPEGRLSLDYTISEDEELEISMEKIQANIVKKYGSNVWL